MAEKYVIVPPPAWPLPAAIQSIAEQIGAQELFMGTTDHIFVANNQLFTTQEVQCLWAVSGRYGTTLRVTFYVLAILSILLRTRRWIARVILGIAMVFSSIAAIHAIVMLALHSHLTANPVEWVSIAVAGSQPSPTIPVWPISWDEDCDAVLAIVGAGYLLTSLMMVWSKTFQDIEAKGILFMWALLMLVGLIAALYSEAFVDLWTFSQFRFCSVSQHGLPPLDSLLSSSIFGRPDPSKTFNETIWEMFLNSSTGPFATCLYPCFEATWPTRPKSGIRVVPTSGSVPSTNGYSNTIAGWRLMSAVYFCVASSGLTSLMIFIAQYAQLGRFNRGTIEPVGFGREIPSWLKYLGYYAKIMSPLSLGLFVAWAEYLIWPWPKDESFSRIGQWGQLASVLLIIFAALASQFDPSSENPWRDLWRDLFGREEIPENDGHEHGGVPEQRPDEVREQGLNGNREGNGTGVQDPQVGPRRRITTHVNGDSAVEMMTLSANNTPEASHSEASSHRNEIQR